MDVGNSSPMGVDAVPVAHLTVYSDSKQCSAKVDNCSLANQGLLRKYQNRQQILCLIYKGVT